MFELLRNAFGRKGREQERAREPVNAGSQAAPPGPALRELGELPPLDPETLADGSGPEPTTGIVGTLRARKLAGMRERANRLAQERRRDAEAAAKTAAEQQDRESKETERDRQLAHRAFQSLADLIEQSAARGLDAAVLADGFVDASPKSGTVARAVTLDGRVWHLRGWQVHFEALCREAGVPLTVVSERVELDPDRKHDRLYHVLAVDLVRL